MKKIIVKVLIFIILLSGYITWHHLHNLPKKLKTIAASAGSITSESTAIGEIVPRQTITVKSQVSGIADKVYAQVGDYVRTNTPLIQIKPNPVPDQLAQKIGTVEQDKAELAAAKIQLENYQYLLKNNIILANNKDYVVALKNYAATSAKYQADQQVLNLYQNGRAIINGKVVENRVNSPINGYILQRNINPGDAINSVSDAQAATVLFTIANMQDLIFEGTVDERDADNIRVGMSAKITVGALPDQIIQGKIISVALQSDQENSKNLGNGASSSGSNSSNNQAAFNVGFQVQIGNLQIPANIHLRSGLSATATMIVKEVKNVVTVPARVIIFKEDKAFLEILNEKTKETRMQAVSLGLSNGANVEITQGIRQGELIVDRS